MATTPYPAPDVILPNETGDIIDIKDFRPNMVVLFFYPRDNTSGCTREAKGFTENIELFNNLNINVFGISKDSISSHEKFIKKQNFQLSNLLLAFLLLKGNFFFLKSENLLTF